LAVGTILLIEQDQNTEFYNLLMKYFLSEGVAAEHGVFLASCDENPTDFFKKLPKDITFDDITDEEKVRSNHN
jgi:elongator complex protein 4